MAAGWPVVGAVLILSLFAGSPVHGEAAPSFELQLREVPPEACVGKPLALEAHVPGHASRDVTIEAILITPAMEALSITFEQKAPRDGTWTGSFTPSEPGQYELDVIARARIAGRKASARKRQRLHIRRGDGIVLRELGEAVELGGVYPGEGARLTVHPELLSDRGNKVKAEVTPLQGPGEAEITAPAMTVSPAEMDRQQLEDGAFTITIAAAVDQPAGRYTGTLRVFSEYDRCILPLHVDVLPPDLQATPAILQIGRIGRGRSAKGTLTVSLAGGGKQPVRITLQPWISQGSKKGPGFYVEGLTREFVLESGSSEAITVTVRAPEDARAGRYTSALLINTPLKELRVPVVAHVVRAPMAIRAMAIIVLGVMVVLLAVLCAWDLYRSLRGGAASPMRRYLLVSALAHAGALLVSALVLVQPTAELAEQSVAVKAVRMSGDRGMAGGGDREAERFLRDLAQLQEQEKSVDLAKADDAQQRNEKNRAEAAELAETLTETELEREEIKKQAEIVEKSPTLAKAQEHPAEQPEVAEHEVEQKRADEIRESAEAQNVELAANDADTNGSKLTAEASRALDLDARELSPEKVEVVALAEPEQVNLEKAPEFLAPTVPALASPEVEQKRADEIRKSAEAQNVELEANDADTNGSKLTAEASRALDLDARELSPARVKVVALAKPEQVNLEKAPEFLAPTVPALASPEVRQKAAAVAPVKEDSRRIALPPAAAEKGARHTTLRSAIVQPLPSRPVAVARTQRTLSAKAEPIVREPQTVAPRPEPREPLLVSDNTPQPEPVVATAEKSAGTEPEGPEPVTIELAMAGPAMGHRPGMRDFAPAPVLPDVMPLSSIRPTQRRPGSSLASPVAALGKGPRIAGLGHQVSGGKIVIGTARYAGDWDCDKTAMPNLAYQLERRVGLAVETETRSVALSSTDIFKCAFLFLSGHSNFQLRPAEIRQLQGYLRAGGALWVNDSTHEGNVTFDSAVRRELARLLPGSKLETIPMDSPLFSACYDLRRGYRGFDIPPGDKYRENRLHGLRIDGRWAVIYSRNDYGDGLEIDPNTHPLMKSLTNLSPREMQEGSIRMGMNLAFYVLSSARGADDVEKLKIADMRRVAAALPAAEEQAKAKVAGRASVPLFQSLNPQEEWKVPQGWSRDRTGVSTDAQGMVTVSITRGQDGKNVIDRTVEGDLSGYRWLVVEVNSRMSAGARLAIGISTGEGWDYFESAPEYVRPGESHDIVFDLTAKTFKSEGTKWEYKARLQNATDVRAIHLLFHPISSGQVAIPNLKLVK